MGPVGFSVHVIDPNRVSHTHDGILQVRINSEAQKWDGWRTYPNREAKWGRSVVGPNAVRVPIGQSNPHIYQFVSD